MQDYPEDVLWSPVWKAWYYAMRLKEEYKTI
jgi:hypothetical protein